jgi:hypothetical protein
MMLLDLSLAISSLEAILANSQRRVVAELKNCVRVVYERFASVSVVLQSFLARNRQKIRSW